MSIKYCQFLIDDGAGGQTYCARLAHMVYNIGGYTFLCTAHHIRLDGRVKNFEKYNEEHEAKVRRLCAYCGKELAVEGYRTRSLLNFCNHNHRGRFYYENSSLKKKNSRGVGRHDGVAAGLE